MDNFKKITIPLLLFLFILINYFQNKSLYQLIQKIEKNHQEIIKQLKNNNFPKTEDKNENNEEISTLKKEIEKIKNQLDDQDELLGIDNLKSIINSASVSPTIELKNYITIKDKKWQKIDVYQDKSFSSKIIGQIFYGEKYQYSKKENGFYYIEFKPYQYGWINGQFLKEL